MRRRLVLSTLAVAVVAVVLLGVPLAVAGALVRLDVAEERVQGRADAIGRAVNEAQSEGRPVTGSLVQARLPDGAQALVRLGDGRVMSFGEPPDEAFLEGRYESPAVDVIVRRDRSQVNGDITRVVLLVATVAAVAFAAAIALGLLQARRLTRPLLDLTRDVGSLGSGTSRPVFQRYGIEEVDRVADVLERTNERVASMLAAERQLASDASHQLRTPLTALSMRLEEIVSCQDLDAVHEEARVALTQVERLAAVVDHLLATARESRSAGAVPVDVDAVVRQQADEWRPSFQAVGRSLRVTGSLGVAAMATPAGLSQVLATLLENSLVHGAGTVSVSTRATGASVVVEVTDEGAGVPAGLGARVFERSVSGSSGTGLGLSLARDLAEADGGRLELVRQQPAVFALFLGVVETHTEPDAETMVVDAAPNGQREGIGPAAASGRTAGKTHRR